MAKSRWYIRRLGRKCGSSHCVTSVPRCADPTRNGMPSCASNQEDCQDIWAADSDAGTQKKIASWLKSQILLNVRVIKYGAVACTGILVNLGTLTFLFTLSSPQGWRQSGVANIVSTVGNFIFHNRWTFSDRPHQGLRMVRGFLSFACMSAAGICITTAAYVGFTRIAAGMRFTNSRPGALGIALTCQLLAIILGGAVSYALNWKFTWAQRKESAPVVAETTEVQEG